MPDSFRLQVLKNLTTCLEGITIAGGYQHDLAGKVFRGRAIFGEGDPIPMVSILEVPIPLDQGDPADLKGYAHGPWALMIQGFVDDDRANPTDPAHNLMADVKKRLAIEARKAVDDYTALGFDAIERIILGPGVVRPADEVSSKAYFYMGLTIQMSEDLMNPFA